MQASNTVIPTTYEQKQKGLIDLHLTKEFWNMFKTLSPADSEVIVVLELAEIARETIIKSGT